MVGVGKRQATIVCAVDHLEGPKLCFSHLGVRLALSLIAITSDGHSGERS